MSNNIIPNFLPPSYDFITEDADEYDTEEEEEEYDTEEEYNTGSLVLYSFVLGLAFFILMESEINVSFEFSVSKSKKNKST